MYKYRDFDVAFIKERNSQFRAQVERRIDGALTEDEFKPLRLMNGLYLQLHAYMLRVAIPYGTLNSRQMHQLAYIADRWDKGSATSPHGRTFSTTGRNSGTCRICWMRWPRCRCTRYRPPATRSAT